MDKWDVNLGTSIEVVEANSPEEAALELSPGVSFVSITPHVDTDALESALAKLKTLGLTQEEARAIVRE